MWLNIQKSLLFNRKGGVFQLCKLWLPDLSHWAHLYAKNAQIEQKLIKVFIENWGIGLGFDRFE